ncbi:DNA cytosine methyltransferase [Candidatus Phytoplasma pyri]|uniref:DNA cytosine methyltransferase n=1 Tax=Candidatus Phytoplasma pyri TaxID=47566 RepID=UPI0039834BAA
MFENQYTIAETFVGAGGSHLGFFKNGFKTVYLNDFCSECVRTLNYNFPILSKVIECEDIKNISKEKISQNITSLDVLFGGVVCKGFSLAGERNLADERNYLYLEQLKLVEKLNPKISIIENVPTFFTSEVLKREHIPNFQNEITILWRNISKLKHQKATKRKKNLDFSEENKILEILKLKRKKFVKSLKQKNVLISVFQDLKQRYEKLGYRIYYHILNSVWYGSATDRNRLIIVAIKNDIQKEYKFPIITHFEYDNPIGKKFLPIVKNPKPYKTVADALALIDYSNKQDLDNKPMIHKQRTVSRFSYIPEGGSVKSVMNILPQNLKLSVFHSRGCNRRLSRNKPSMTLVPGHSAFPIHPTKNRSITVREAACITGFPIDYKFFGSHTNRCEQVGNAVPIELSTAIAFSIKTFLDEINDRK